MSYNLSKYADISRLIKDKEYANDLFLKVKQMNKLYIIKYDKSKLTIGNTEHLGLFRSVITDGNKILSMAPPKALDFDIFAQSNQYENCSFKEFI